MRHHTDRRSVVAFHLLGSNWLLNQSDNRPTIIVSFLPLETGIEQTRVRFADWHLARNRVVIGRHIAAKDTISVSHSRNFLRRRHGVPRKPDTVTGQARTQACRRRQCERVWDLHLVRQTSAPAIG